ncbi:MAG: hypothetical protein JKX81_14185 [Arenicella sp.]|nr:hypothetical protein [Arenicella sp.]
MRKRIWMPLCLMLLLIIEVLFWPTDENISETIVAKAPITTEPAKPVILEQEINAEDASASTKEPVEEFNPYESEVFKAQILQVADLYAESAKYPINSKPILNPNDAKIMQPFEETEVDTPFPSEDGTGKIRLAAAVDKYQYFVGDPIDVRLQLTGAKEGVFTSAVATLSGPNGDTPLSATMNPSDPTLTAFTTSFDTSIAPPALMSAEMLMKITVTVDDQQFFTTVGFRYALASAQLISISPVRQNAAELIIPLHYNVFQDGYYFVRAILEDAQDSRPLIQLQSEGRLAQGNAILELRAHISALKAQGSAGPYILRSVQTYRGAEVGETFDAPASTSQQRFSIPGFPFSDYDETEHEDPLAVERVEFLRGLGVVDEDPVEE